MSRFSVIIPSRNAANLVPCVTAVKKLEPCAEVIIVEDFPTPQALMEAREEVIAKCPGTGSVGKICKFVEGIRPFVFARNVNRGIHDACEMGHSADAFIVLNDDAILQSPGGFSLLAKTAEEHPEYGIIAATCNNVGNVNQRWRSAGGLREDPRMVCFVAVLIPRRTIETVGLLDTRFVNYGLDDDDYSLRVRKAGLKIGIHDGCYVDHGSLTSSYRGAAGAGGNYLPNMKLYIEKWGVDNWGKDRAHSQFANLFPAEVSA